MAKHYRFESYDDEDNSTTSVEFSTENDAWSGYDGPMWKFLDFLKGCGYVFGTNTRIGVMTKDGEFIEAAD